MIARRLITALLIALTISGIFTFWLSRKFSKPAVAAVVHQHYVAAAQNLEAGDMLRTTSLKLIEWPASSPLEGAYAKPEDVAGRIVLFPLAAGEPILERQLSAPGSGAGLAVKIPDGMRAISLKSNDVVGVSGFLAPGSHVDVILTYHHAASPQPVTSTILQDVQVIAAGQKIQPDPEGKPITVDVVTLLVSPQDADRVVLAGSLGTVQFVLRNGNDRGQVKENAVEVSELDNTVAPPPVARVGTPRKTVRATPAEPYKVETISGSKQSVESFK